ncbi:MAG: OmpA family protein [Spirochaetaceae bacterium]|jgi:outer membrane protein OmpA-like peptidoglycan-associated protein|nr:OmpA family protein [Spirochaetaceae bacterium]
MSILTIMKRHFGILTLFLLISAPAWPEEFAFKHKVGDKFKTISTSTENVLLNGKILYGTRILNRMASEVAETRDGVAVHKARFQLAEERQVEGAWNFHWTGEYDSLFGRDALGRITIDDDYVMPTVRNVPVFPDKPLEPGGTWQADGCEAHDLGPTFGLDRLYRLPFTANYTFLGEREWRGRRYAAIEISYTVDDKPASFPPGGGNEPADFFPLRVQGESFQTVYWDGALGQPAGAEEMFTLKFTMSDGNVYEFNGRAEAEIIESPAMDKDAVADEIRRELSDEEIDDADVRVVDEGVKINLENILFEPDTAILVRGEEKKLEKIGELLRKYPGRDIMVGGHAARAGGTEASRQRLSQERAAAVAAYLIENGVRTADRVMARGYGSSRPVADNGTEAGRKKNRRVEIIILEN